MNPRQSVFSASKNELSRNYDTLKSNEEQRRPVSDTGSTWVTPDREGSGVRCNWFQSGDLMPGLIRRQGKNVRIQRSRRSAGLRMASADGRLDKSAGCGWWSASVRGAVEEAHCHCHHESGLRPRQVVASHEKRWLFKELAQD
jgi:hypothetical protein